VVFRECALIRLCRARNQAPTDNPPLCRALRGGAVRRRRPAASVRASQAACVRGTPLQR